MYDYYRMSHRVLHKGPKMSLTVSYLSCEVLVSFKSVCYKIDWGQTIVRRTSNGLHEAFVNKLWFQIAKPPKIWNTI